MMKRACLQMSLNYSQRVKYILASRTDTPEFAAQVPSASWCRTCAMFECCKLSQLRHINAPWSLVTNSLCYNAGTGGPGRGVL